jgi:hypothetical protein
MRCRFMAMNGHGNRYRYDEGLLGMRGKGACIFFFCHCSFGSLCIVVNKLRGFLSMTEEEKGGCISAGIWTLWQRLYRRYRRAGKLFP